MLPWWKRWLKWIAVASGIAIVSGFVLTILLVLVFSRGLPDVGSGEDLLQAESTLIMDREGNILYAVHGEENREIVPIENISTYLKDATVAVEDDEYYEHYGFDLPCYVKAVAHELFGLGIRRGCSTITQQLVKNIFLSPEQTYIRKLQELILAIRVESRFDKDEILELYLNEIPYGNNAYGAELAAKTYFDKEAYDLTLTESAIMASLPKAPTRYSPYGSNRNSYLTVEFTDTQLQDRNISDIEDLNYDEYVLGLIGTNIDLVNEETLYLPGRVDIVLAAMEDQGMITEDQEETALEESWDIEFTSYRENIEAPHFVLYVKELIEDKYGKDVVEQGGLQVYTTLDPVMQEYAEEAVETYRDRNSSQFDAHNASLVSVHPQTGQILAMVGSADYFDEEIDGNVNIATRYRQPGSSFKPFVYALAFLNGYAPATVMYDVETQFGPGEWPQNYDGEFQGPIRIREALAYSRNIPAIKSYFLAGQETDIIPFMEGFGIELDDSIGYGWPLALGSGEVRLLDLVGAYGVFANSGVKQELSPILKIENRDGEILEKWEDQVGEEVLDPQVAYLITDVLSDSEINLGSRLRVSGHYVAAKTGTSNTKDEYGENAPNNALTLGYSNKLATGVWVGNADGAPMSYTANGYDTAGTIWNDYMTNALSDLTPESFTRPTGITEIEVTKSSGKLPSAYTPEDMIITEKFASFNIPTEVDGLWATAVVDGFSGLVATEYSPSWSLEEQEFQQHTAIIPDYTYWQAGIDAWVQEKIDEGEMDAFLEPTDLDDEHTASTWAKQPEIIITSPGTYSLIERGQNTVEIEVEALNGLDKVEFYLDGTLQYTAVSAPYTGQVRAATNASSGRQYTISAYAYDDLGYRTGASIAVEVE
jgi:membrane peptidoglycan carboxypeptidase